MKLLIYGAGVIGSLYAELFANAGIDTSIYARGRRLENLKTKGLLYLEKGEVRKVKVSVLSELKDDDCYDFIFITVRENQLYQALEELKRNQSKNIVMMVNSIDDYSSLEKICGYGRIIPAFPGAGGSIQGDILDAGLTPRLIQPTTFAEISGEKTERTRELCKIFKKAGIPYQQVSNMHVWQLCHLAMVVPLADAYYEAENPKQAWKETAVMKKTAMRLKRNFRLLKKSCGYLSPTKMNLFCLVPLPVLTKCLSLVYQSAFAEKFMYRHSEKAPDEMRQLHRQFYAYVRRQKW